MTPNMSRAPFTCELEMTPDSLMGDDCQRIQAANDAQRSSVSNKGWYGGDI
jgi:hypothetical protein